MFHFLDLRVRIMNDHMKDLQRYFDSQGIAYETQNQILYGDELVEGDCYISCAYVAIDAGPIERDRIFEVQLPHNLTGIKGNNIAKSKADLNILGGRRIADCQRLNLSDPRFLIGGYAKWDRIYPERFRIEERRTELIRDRGLDPGLPWVCFYPTGPNETFWGGMDQAFSTLLEVERKLGPMEFLICDHANNRKYRHSRQVIERIVELAGNREGSVDSSHVGGTGKSRMHLVDGADALRHIVACNLFITDIASTLVTAMSMKKPVAMLRFKEMELPFVKEAGFDRCRLLEDIDDLGEYITNYQMDEGVSAFFRECVEYDDDRNCERITEIIVSRYEDWKNRNH